MVVIRGLEEGEMETCYCMCTQLQFYMVWVSQDWHERKLTDTRCYLLSTTEGSFLTSSHLSFSLNIYLAVQGLYFSKWDLAPWPGIEPGLPALGEQSFNHWITREVHKVKVTRLLWQWDCSGKNTGVGCHSLLQRICLSPGSSLGPLYCRWILYHLSHQESPCYFG